MKNSETISDLEISFHPLPILNISDHQIRNQLQNPSNPNQIYGALIGTQIGRKLEIVNSFEILIQDEVVDQSFMTTRQEQFKQVFPTLDLLGWYTIGQKPTINHLNIQIQLTSFFELNSPLLVLYSNSSTPTTNNHKEIEDSNKDIPIEIFEFLNLDSNHQQPSSSEEQSNYLKCNYTVETSEAERIAVDYIAKPNLGNSKENALIANLTTQRNAIKMLHLRLESILDYLNLIIETTNQTSNPNDQDLNHHEILRQISSLLSSLPKANDHHEFVQEYSKENNDALLTHYLTTQTKSINQSNQLIDKFLYLLSRDRDSSRDGGGRDNERDIMKMNSEFNQTKFKSSNLSSFLK
ncbi:uncharacterized protein MELLADRAFT_101852 [Melampsora larici-populina 98AG31]|uniref:COP9 signalosome complex subunit 6 n=1 Tax=Melampsora larici-populina (strain 98AG31 / pathotype 3-4-7) TaxID=747676 RepID=F4R541_MELLP|nr:uncharacterized protein MELLADRAFT_101852 [Melampsora larici-populina 98AG31]EGG12336.1 hypothetical protein MELLADRAFT_101852 [Melampsora larici-populina 98AG31]